MKTIFDINGFIVNTLGFSSGMWLLSASILFALLCFCFVLTVRNGRIKPMTCWIESLWLVAWTAFLLGLGLVAWAPEGGTALWRPSQPMWVWFAAAAVLICLFIWYFRRRKKHFADLVSATAIRRSAANSGASKYCYALLFASMLVLCMFSITFGLLPFFGLNLVHLVVTMTIVVLSLLLNALTGWRFWYLFGALLLIAFDFLMLQQLLAMSNFSFMPLLAMIPLCLATILPMLSLGTMKK
jgi:hypothetical protein